MASLAEGALGIWWYRCLRYRKVRSGHQHHESNPQAERAPMHASPHRGRRFP
jgi:hypothetical protein